MPKFVLKIVDPEDITKIAAEYELDIHPHKGDGVTLPDGRKGVITSLSLDDDMAFEVARIKLVKAT